MSLFSFLSNNGAVNEESSEAEPLILRRRKQSRATTLWRYWLQFCPSDRDAALTHKQKFQYSSIKRRGISRNPFTDVYYTLMRLHTKPIIDWMMFFVVIICWFTLVALVFTCIYWIEPSSIKSFGDDPTFAEVFFFSMFINTKLASPVLEHGPFARTVSIIQSLVSLLMVAVTTGLVFQKFSHVNPRIRFSEVAVVNSFQGTPAIMFRIANLRGNKVIGATMTVNYAYNDPISGLRLLKPLKLVRDRSMLFRLTWTIIHVIDEDSPLYGEDKHSLVEKDVEFIAVLTGHDADFGKFMHSANAYVVEDIIWNAKFVDVLSRKRGRRVFDMRKFHDVILLGHNPDVDEEEGAIHREGKWYQTMAKESLGRVRTATANFLSLPKPSGADLHVATTTPSCTTSSDGEESSSYSSENAHSSS